jgi:hypothetical protein
MGRIRRKCVTTFVAFELELFARCDGHLVRKDGVITAQKALNLQLVGPTSETSWRAGFTTWITAQLFTGAVWAP